MNQALFDGELIYLAVPDPDKDAEVEARWTQDADYMHLLGSESAYPLTPGQIKQRYEESRKQGDREFWFTIHARADDRLIGFSKLIWIEWSQQSAALQLGIGDAADRGRGYGREALRLTLHYAFNELNLQRLAAMAPGDNVAAQRLLTQAAFSLDVRLRDAFNRGGRRYDRLHYGILQDEWRRGLPDVGGVARIDAPGADIPRLPALQSTRLFEGDKVRLGPITPEVVAPLFAAWSRQAEYRRLLDADPVRPWLTGVVKEDLVKDQLRDAQRRSLDEYWFMIHRLADDRPIGFVSVNGIQWMHGTGWVSIGIGETDCWGQGYGSDAMRVMQRYAFTELNLQRLTLSVFAYNARARRSYEKTGFAVEGIGRAALLREGRRWDEVFMGILRDEWQATAPGGGIT